MASNRVLCISYFFPPVAESGVHRTRAIVRYLPAFGWHPIVVAADSGSKYPKDESLLRGLPDDLAVYRTFAPDLLTFVSRFRPRIPQLSRGPEEPDSCSCSESPRSALGLPGQIRRLIDWSSWWLQLPDLGVGWTPWGVSAACRAARRHGCRAIYSSAPFWTAHLVAMITKQLTGLPWVADFRDPWRVNPFRKISFRSLDRYDAWLERQVVSLADRVICNSDPVRADFRARFPGRADRFVTIPNGFDPEDFATLESMRPAGPDRLVLTHAGVFYGRRSPEPILRALRLLRDRGEWGRKPLLQLVGPPDYDGRCLMEMAVSYGVDDLVHLTGQVEHRRALELMKGSDVQILIGFNGPGSELQVPAKLFEYMGVGRPVLALAPEDSAIGDIMSRCSIPGMTCDPENPAEIAAAIASLGDGSYERQDGLSAGPALAQFNRRNQVRRVAELLDEIRRETA